MPHAVELGLIGGQTRVFAKMCTARSQQRKGRPSLFADDCSTHAKLRVNARGRDEGRRGTGKDVGACGWVCEREGKPSLFTA